jgi:hypothetical protein
MDLPECPGGREGPRLLAFGHCEVPRTLMSRESCRVSEANAWRQFSVSQDNEVARCRNMGGTPQFGDRYSRGYCDIYYDVSEYTYAECGVCCGAPPLPRGSVGSPGLCNGFFGDFDSTRMFSASGILCEHARANVATAAMQAMAELQVKCAREGGLFTHTNIITATSCLKNILLLRHTAYLSVGYSCCKGKAHNATLDDDDMDYGGYMAADDGTVYVNTVIPETDIDDKNVEAFDSVDDGSSSSSLTGVLDGMSDAHTSCVSATSALLSISTMLLAVL